MTKIELTAEQRNCVEYPLQEQILIIDADPGTGKTEILRHRVKFIHQENKTQRKFILVLAVGKSISRSIKKKLKEEGLKKIYHRLKDVIPKFSHQILPCEDTDCPDCQEHNQPLILTCTVHSIAYWMVKKAFTKQFQERKKIQILTNA
jgi:superfamily I DNA/RNA helicase